MTHHYTTRLPSHRTNFKLVLDTAVERIEVEKTRRTCHHLTKFCLLRLYFKNPNDLNIFK